MHHIDLNTVKLAIAQTIYKLTNLVCVDTVHFHVIALFEKFGEKWNPPKVSCGNRFFSFFQRLANNTGVRRDGVETNLRLNLGQVAASSRGLIFSRHRGHKRHFFAATLQQGAVEVRVSYDDIGATTSKSSSQNLPCTPSKRKKGDSDDEEVECQTPRQKGARTSFDEEIGAKIKENTPNSM